MTNLPGVIAEPTGGLTLDPDNAIVETELTGDMAARDREGRLVISYSQFQNLRRRGARVEGYALRVKQDPEFVRERGVKYYPDRVWIVPANKLMKWRYYGLVPVGESVTQERSTPKRPPVAEKPADMPKIYFCSDKYPDCPRFFDNTKGLQFHWKKDHGEMSTRSRKAKEEEVVDAEG